MFFFGVYLSLNLSRFAGGIKILLAASFDSYWKVSENKNVLLDSVCS